jgi:hypothetical protein
LGADAVLRKPFMTNDLGTMVALLLNRKRDTAAEIRVAADESPPPASSDHHV